MENNDKEKQVKMFPRTTEDQPRQGILNLWLCQLVPLGGFLHITQQPGRSGHKTDVL